MARVSAAKTRYRKPAIQLNSGFFYKFKNTISRRTNYART
ncbi:hypothetical protein NTHI1209_01591 [Haemophilus influenzae]|uniref:Uncharacterized protein n=1 Tax=Haemophilus influenzae TaxID=727 RepID=A0A158SYM4_HAEIF|nr:hypothetical protein NTHI1209_01591 [Haemophilus influenzae]